MIRRIAIVLLLSVPLAAQVTPKQAVAQFKSAAKAELGVFKDEVKLRHEEFLTDLQGISTGYANGQLFWQDVVQALGGTLSQLQAGLQADLNASLLDAMTAGAGALQALGASGDAYPLDMYFGTGGALDDVVRDYHAAFDKELVATAKALKKITKALDKTDSVVLLVKLVRPDFNDHFCVNDSAFTFEGAALTVSTVVTASARGTASDGLFVIAGTGYTGTVNVSFDGPAFFSDAVFVDDETHTWSFSGGPGLDEGNYVVQAWIDSDTSSVIFNIGVP